MAEEDIRMCRLARLMNWTAIATGPGWQVLKGTPASKRPPHASAAGAKFAERPSFVYFASVCAVVPEAPSRYRPKGMDALRALIRLDG
jgi:hypothetical protein